MERRRFVEIVREALDELPERFRQYIRNVAVLVEDEPAPPAAGRRRPRALSPRPSRLVLGVFRGVPLTEKSVFQVPGGPDTIVLYQKNIEAVCASEAEIREQVRRTVVHEFGHYFGLDEDRLREV